jgi:hypothetical protein
MINEKCKMTAESPFTARHDFAVFILHLSFFNPSSFTETSSRQNGFHQSTLAAPPLDQSDFGQHPGAGERGQSVFRAGRARLQESDTK